MHAIQGAMAVRRAREKREQRRSSKHKNKGEGGDPAADGGVGSQLSLEYVDHAPKTESCMTAFHLGVVFILLGFLMVFSSMISGSVKESDWSQLLGVGATFIIVGLVMVMVNRIITEKEEEELTRYVHHRLARSRSGQALVRDVEAGDELRHHRVKSVRHGKMARRKDGKNFVRLKSGTVKSKKGGGNGTAAAHHASSDSVVNGVHPPLVKVTTEVASVAGGLKTRETSFSVENERRTPPSPSATPLLEGGATNGKGAPIPAFSETSAADNSCDSVLAAAAADRETEKLLPKSESSTSANIVASLVEAKHTSSAAGRKSSKRRKPQQETSSSTYSSTTSTSRGGIVTTSIVRTTRTSSSSSTGAAGVHDQTLPPT